MQQFNKGDHHYSRFLDAIQTSDIKYIYSKTCRKHYKNNWWEKYNGLAIKTLIQTENIKLINIISKSIIHTTILSDNIAEYANEAMFNKYIKCIKFMPCKIEIRNFYANTGNKQFIDRKKCVDHNYICKIYHCPKINDKIKKLCNNKKYLCNNDANTIRYIFSCDQQKCSNFHHKDTHD